jgi:murein DD-endopeptidase MepM/ murein hydrolase activator NlpD
LLNFINQTPAIGRSCGTAFALASPVGGKPVRAVANGNVEDWVDNEPTNTITADSNGKLQLPSPTPDPVSGNRFWIRHGDVLVEYAHLQAGTLAPSLLVKGAPVTAGQKLGLAGNSGNSTNPHTHIQCQRDSLSGPLRAMPFRDAWTLDRTRFNSPDSHSLWVQLKAHGIPQEPVAIWPGFYLPRFYDFEAAIDPLALILRGDIYIKLTLPDPPRIEVLRAGIEELVRTMTPDERKQPLERVRAFKDYQNVVEQELLHRGKHLK